MTKLLKISNRLKTIGDLVSNNQKVIDVGCDHAFLSIYLTLNKNCHVIATDINKLPLEEAKKNIKNFNLQNKIKLVLSDGLKNINEDFDTLIISGMGANTIINIINNDMDKVKKAKQIIIQSNKDLYNIRKYFLKNYFKITNEVTLYENGKYYTIIVFENSSELITLNENELYFGEYKYRNNKMFIQYKNYLLKKYKNIVKQKNIENINKLIKYLQENNLNK